MDYRNGPSKGTAGIRGKDDDKKLFVGGLPKLCGEKELNETFSKFGTIESINIKKDPITKVPRGFCFIVFSDPNVVDQILSSGDICVNGKKVDPRRVTKTTPPGKIFIGGLTTDFTEEKIKEHFSQYGKITDVQWPFDRQKNQKRAYCFLTFENRDTVTELLKTPKQEVLGKELDVKKVKLNPETMWQHGGAIGAYPGGRGRGAYAPAYGAAYTYPAYGYDYAPVDYTGYEDYCKAYETYYDNYDYDAYPPAYAPRAPRGGRTVGGYARHAPY
ncbi:RNA-binding protein squid, putative [Pediculus humanus corporis]|uniref:RNA-binding protein squid, putative n=1 Tax=Pediculus humanus subsp. corporis TaxID=121224 RepID=E0W4A9_PEDHC|nr:RNA-binding protein squid, putative [Pediculus humanus corporis]EEB20465.1 RNA-binding protein squid, putative [Pediculus humanus corporis]